MRIGVVAHAAVGGSGTVAAELAQAMARRGHELHIIGTAGHPRLLEHPAIHIHDSAIAEHSLWSAPPSALALASHLAQVAGDADLDLVHAHFAIPYGVAACLANPLSRAAVPTVLTLHGTDVTQLADDDIWAPWLRYAMEHAARVTVPSEFLRREVVSRFPSSRPGIIHNFVDTERFTPPDSRPLPGPGEPLILVHASNFRRIKRVGDVVEIAARIARARPVRLLFLGDGPDRPAALARVRELGLESSVEAPGADADVWPYLSRAHVALLPSESESFGLFALEAMACGVPVVASNTGGLPQVVCHGQTGYLEEVGDTEAMARRVLELTEASEAWHTMSRRAVDRARSEFTLRRAVDAYEATYHDVVLASSNTAAS